MKRKLFGILIAQVVLYVFGFLWWGLGPYPKLIWKTSVNPELAAKALAEQFPANGTYFVPSTVGDAQAVDTTMRAGPVAFVHMLALNGRPAADPTIMAGGFVFNLVSIVFITWLLVRSLPATPTYISRVQFVALAGFIAAFFIDGGEIAWWGMPIAWKLYQAAYNFLFWVIGGLILAWFVRPEE